MCVSSYFHGAQGIVFCCSFIEFLQRLQANKLRCTAQKESPLKKFYRKIRRPLALKRFFHEQLSSDLARLRRPMRSSWLVTCDGFINVLWNTAIVLYQNFFAPIHTVFFCSGCQIVRDQTRTNFFTARCSCNIECMLVEELPKDASISRSCIISLRMVSMFFDTMPMTVGHDWIHLTSFSQCCSMVLHRKKIFSS